MYIEADFLREYGIYLCREWNNPDFGWRLFFSLVRGLGPDSTYSIMSHPKNENEGVDHVFAEGSEEQATQWILGQGAAHREKKG